MENYVRLCSLDDLAPDQSRCFHVGDRAVFVVLHQDKVYAIDNRCGHMNAALHRGEFTDGLIVCPLHGAAFRVDSGAVEWDAILPPPMAQYSSSDDPRLRNFGLLLEEVETRAVEAFPVSVQGDEVFIRLS